MNIGIDIDGVLTDLETFMKERGKVFFNMGVQNEEGEDLDSLFNVSRSEADRFWDKNFKDYVFNIAPRSGVKEMLNSLHESGNKILIVTARRNHAVYQIGTDSNFKAKTQEFLDKNGLYYDELHFYPSPKVDAVKDLKLDLFIEDSPSNSLAISKFIKVVIMDSSYNRNLVGENIMHAKNPLEVLSVVENLKGQEIKGEIK